MAKDERTSKRIQKLAADVLNGFKEPTKKEILSMAGELVNLSPDKKKPIKKKSS